MRFTAINALKNFSSSQVTTDGSVEFNSLVLKSRRTRDPLPEGGLTATCWQQCRLKGNVRCKIVYVNDRRREWKELCSHRINPSPLSVPC